MQFACIRCGTAFEPIYWGQKTCSRDCSAERQIRLRREQEQRRLARHHRVPGSSQRRGLNDYGERACIVCGDRFQVVWGPSQITCSHRCSLERYRQRRREKNKQKLRRQRSARPLPPERLCAQCGTTFHPARTGSGRPSKYCGEVCRREAARIQTANRPKPPPKPKPERYCDDCEIDLREIGARQLRGQLLCPGCAEARKHDPVWIERRKSEKRGRAMHRYYTDFALRDRMAQQSRERRRQAATAVQAAIEEGIIERGDKKILPVSVRPPWKPSRKKRGLPALPPGRPPGRPGAYSDQRLTQERRQRARALILEYPWQTDLNIADLAGCSASMAAKVRRELVEAGEVEARKRPSGIVTAFRKRNMAGEVYAVATWREELCVSTAAAWVPRATRLPHWPPTAAVVYSNPLREHQRERERERFTIMYAFKAEKLIA